MSDQNATSEFLNAVSLQQAQKWDEALNVYLKLLDQSHDHLSASKIAHNISLIYKSKNESGLAYVYNKKALALDAHNTAAQEFSPIIQDSFKVQEIPHDITIKQQIDSLGLKYFSLEVLSAFLIAFVFLFLKQFHHHLIQRKKAQVENKHPEKWPLKGTIYAVLIVFISLGLFIQWSDTQQAKAIVYQHQINIQIAAGPDQPVIAELTQGNEVEVLNFKTVESTEYAQIRLKGAFTGWVKKSDILALNYP